MLSKYRILLYNLEMRLPSSALPSVKLQLHEWAALRSELIWIYDREVRPLYLSGRKEAQVGYRVWLIRRGSVAIKTTTRTIVVGAGKWVMPGEDFCEHHFSARAHILSVHFICQWPSGENLIACDRTLVLKNDASSELERAAKGLNRLLRHEFPEEGRREQHYNRQLSDYQVFNRFQSLLLEWLATWYRICLKNGCQLTRLTTGDSRPFEVARCLNQASLDQPFPAEQLQRITGLSLARLNQLFFREFKLTMRKFWDRRRLDFAKQCLETSDMRIKEVSYRLNFRSNSHFVLWFRRLTRSRPSDFRQAYLGEKPPRSRQPDSQQR